MRQYLKRTVFKQNAWIRRFITYLVLSTQYSQNIVLYNDFEELLILLLMPHLWDSTLNEPSLNKTFKFEKILPN